MIKKIIVAAKWDAEASVWIATSKDLPELITEASNPTELEKKLKIMIPEILEMREEDEKLSNLTCNFVANRARDVNIPIELLLQKSIFAKITATI